MVRTKGDRVPTRAVGGKAPTSKAASNTPTRSVASGSKGRSYSGGNRACPRETPEWQKPITCFINQEPSASDSVDNSRHDTSADDMQPGTSED